MKIDESCSKAPVVVCTGFHRSATSAVAHYLHKAGLNMGNQLMGPDISNPGGHFEDVPVVNIHESLLKAAGTSWQYSGEVRLDESTHELISRYIAARSSESEAWGFKDPRAMLYLRAWDTVLEERGRYLFVIRHWAECVESLLNRHSRSLAHGVAANVDRDLVFWIDADLAAKMWLSYNKKLLEFITSGSPKRLIVTHRAVLNGFSLVEQANSRFDLQLDTKTETPISLSLSNSRASTLVRESLSSFFQAELDATWQQLLEQADYCSDTETVDYYEPENISSSIVCRVKAISNRTIKARESSRVKFDHSDFMSQLPKIAYVTEFESMLRKAGKHKVLADQELTVELRGVVDRRFPFSQVAYHALANYLFNFGAYAEALSCYVEAVLLGKPHPHFFASIAKCHVGMSDDSRAIFYFDKAIEGNSRNAMFYCGKAGVLQRLGQTEEAIEQYRKALEVAPKDRRVVLIVARSLDEAGFSDEALQLIIPLRDLADKNIERMYVKLMLKKNYAVGQKAYRALVNSDAVRGNREQSLANLLIDIRLSCSEKDLIYRVEQHWLALG